MDCGNEKEQGETFRDYGYVKYLDAGDGFMGTYLNQKLSKYSLCFG